MTCIVGDIGGTNARFAYLGADGTILDARALRTADYPGLAAALRAYIEQGGGAAPVHVGLAVAAAVTTDTIRFLNSPWIFSQRDIRDEFQLQTLAVLNDFSAQALSLPSLREDQGDLVVLARGVDKPQAARAVLGPGTGLGVSGLVPGRDGQWVPIQGEGGHINFAPCCALEIEVCRWLTQQHGRTSVERMVSGSGIENIYLALQAIRGMPADVRLSAAEIVRRAQVDSDPQATATLQMFCAVLGSFAGDVALMLGAFGGIYIGGGIVPRILDQLKTSEFLPRFYLKAPADHLMRDIPIYAITSRFPGLIGAGNYLRHCLNTASP